ncbi:MAG TPA: response regulator [Caulobacteraceae bacterium]|jgi:signal transduction histidine kinase/DNA-binding response OmpR family regulator|nr:response regulator [Caulobacteraceae bacterium]
MRAHDWDASPLGTPQAWPLSLQTAVRIILSSRQPMWIGWGPELTYLYNDAYKSIIGGKHPWALGRPTSEVWREIWSDIGPMLDQALSGAEGTYVEAQRLVMERNGYPEETYYTFSYSPVPNDDGTVGGIICANTDDTLRVIGQRQMALLRDLAAETADARTPREACERAVGAVTTNGRDIPFALIYMLSEDGNRLVLAAASGIAAGSAIAPLSLPLEGAAPLPVAEVIHNQAPRILTDLELSADDLETGEDLAPSRVAILPISPAADASSAAALVAGLNPYRLVDDNALSFLDLVSNQVTAAVHNAVAYDEARRRAEALAELDRAKTTFFSNVSHEFRTPLTLMLGPMEDALAEGQLGDSRQLIETAHRNGLRLLKLVNNLLDFSRLEAGRSHATYEPTDLPAYTAELASSFRSATDRAGLKLVVDAPPLPQLVSVDHDMWEKVVLNLLSNAFKFTLEGEIVIQVRESADGQGAEVSVRDTGIGIPAAELPRLFERFHRVEGVRGRTIEGTGIGLALVSELVKLHGGEITVESEPGHGTRFTIRLPYGSGHLPLDRVHEGRSEAGARWAQTYVDEALRWLPQTPGAENAVAAEQISDHSVKPISDEVQGQRVLIADDNTDMRDYVCRLLESRGFDVEAVANGRAALEAARANPPDLVLSDVMMPELDGFGLLEALRHAPELQDVPVILLSARAGEEARVEGLDAGADDYLVKPFSARELLARVSSTLQLARMRRDAADALREEARALELLNEVGATVAAELDLSRAVQAVTDAAKELSGAEFGAFFYNVLDEKGEWYTLYTLSGAPREAFSKFPMPRNTQVFGPTFVGEGVVRSGNIVKDARYGHNAPYYGMPKGHLPVCSYLAVPVISRSGEVVGGLFFGHPEENVFDERAERIVIGIAAQAAIAIDNARLYQAAQTEISRRAMTEQALRESEEQLERKVTERTSELAAANRQLVRQIEERERVEATLRQMQRLEAVGQLTSGVAHDFNNLLTVVIGSLDFMQRDATDATNKRRISLAREAAERGAKLTAQLLAFSRRQRLEPKALNLNDTVTGMQDLLQSTLGGAAKLRVVLEPDLWSALVDPTQIELVILNLAINARDALPVGGDLTIETHNETIERRSTRPEDADVGDYVVIAVRDNGAGMAPEIAERAFEPFFTTKPVGKGSGLGLAQVFGFAKQSGGGVSLQTAPGQGTTVKVYLPRAMSAAEARQAPRSATAAKPLHRLMLLVDDDAAVREVEAETLRAAGYGVIETGSGGAAIEQVRDRKDIDAVVMDFAMPGMNGAEVAREIAAIRPDLPVLFVSGFGDLALLGEVGEQRIVQKPFKPEELTAKIEALFVHARPREAQTS